MRMVMRLGLLTGAIALARRATRPGTPGHRAVRRAARAASEKVRYARGRAQGAKYRMSGRHPDENASGTTLADRVRSVLGPLEKRLDVPHVNVLAEGHSILLHGVVATPDDASAIEEAVERIPGVEGVESYLHVGISASDTQPSKGRAVRSSSEAYERMVGAARNAGLDPERAPAAVRTVLSTLMERIPSGERDHVLTHLPSDLRALASPPRRAGLRTELRHTDDFVAAIRRRAGLGDDAAFVVESLLGAIRELVPEEEADIAAVLPAELRDLWLGAVPQ